MWPTYRSGDLQLRSAHTDAAGNWVLPELVILYYQLLKYIFDFGLFANTVQLGAPWIDINFWNIFFLVGFSTRPVESKSREKSKNRKKSGKIRKIGFDFLLDFLAKMPKCHKMPKCLHFGSGCIRIFCYYIIIYLNLKAWTKGPT